MKIKILTVLLMIFIMFTLSGVAAGDVNDTIVANADNQLTLQVNDEILSVENELNELGTNPGNYSGLADEIADNPHVELEHDYYAFDHGPTIEITTDNQIIDGRGAVIDMAGSDIQAFKVNASGVLIRNLTIKNANIADDGGAIYFGNSGSVINCNFINNSASNGGAIYFENSGNVTNCNFTNDEASTDGGAIYFAEDSTGRILNCNFADNNATASSSYGGAICFYGAGDVTGSKFTNNSAGDYGGAVYMDSGNVTKCTFTNNSASSGGAIFVNWEYAGNVTGSNFTNNSASSCGGAIYFYGEGEVTNCNFINNTASNSNGGAVWICSGRVEKSNFTDNAAFIGYGGAIFIEEDGSVEYCTFVKNIAFDVGRGGAINFDEDSKGTVDYCNFTDNSAKCGGAINIEQNCNVNVENCNFANNNGTDHGGAINIDSYGECNVENCNFTNNTANFGGAASFSSKGVLTNCNFVNNSACGKLAGGGALLFLNSGEVTKCNFVNNSASEYGGAIDFEDEFTLADCNFTNNNVTQLGGAVYFKNGGEVTNCNLINNSAKSGGAFYFKEDGKVTGCNFTNNTASSSGGAIDFSGASTITDCIFINNNAFDADSNGGAVAFWDDGNVVDCSFTNNAAAYGAIYFGTNILSFGTNTWTVENCNFTDNSAYLKGAAIYFGGGAMSRSSGAVEKCNFFNNTAFDGEGGAVWIYSGSIKNSNFTNNTDNNKATTNQLGGGAIWIYSGSVEGCNFANNKANTRGGAISITSKCDVLNCSFTNNSALEGGAISTNYGCNVTNCSFTANNATTGSAIYFFNAGSTNPRTISHSSFLNNRANMTDDDLEVTINENNITIVFMGQNNLINAIYSKNNVEISLTNVTYWGANGITNTGNVAVKPSRSNKEAGQNITVGVVVNDKLVLNDVKLTDENGTVVLDVKIDGDYFIGVRHDEDSYYTEAEKTLSNMTFYVNVTSMTTHNKTVNITAKSNIFNETMPGRLQFILSNTTKINASYASNGTWWAVHTFDDYANYSINASYVGLDNVVINNATISITKANSTADFDIVLDYGQSSNVTVLTQGATGITAKIDENNVTVIDNFTIPLSGLDAGNYTLTVTTIPDDDHIAVTKSFKITVNKAHAQIQVVNETINVKIHDFVSDLASLIPSDAGQLRFVSSDEDIVWVIGDMIYACEKGTAILTVSFDGNNNYEPAQNKTITVNVELKDSSIIVENDTIDLNVDDEYMIEAVHDPSFMPIYFSSSNESVASVNEYGEFKAIAEGTAIITLTLGDNKTFEITSANVTVRVSKIPTEIKANDVEMTFGDKSGIVYELSPADAKGNISFESDNPDVVMVDANGNLTAISAGSANVTIAFSGNEKYAKSNKTIRVTVNKANSTLSFEVPVLTYGTSVNITVNTTGATGITAKIGDENIMVDGNVIVMPADLDAGPYAMSVTTMPDENHNAANRKVAIWINKANSTIATDVVVDGNDVTVNVTVNSSATGLVEFNIAGKTYYAPVNEGMAVLTSYFPVGRYMGNIKYLGDDNFNDAATLLYFTVSEPVKLNTTISCDVSVDGNNVSVSVNVDSNATGFVEFNIGGKKYYAPVNDGMAVLTSYFPVGRYMGNIKYLGDDNFNDAATLLYFTVSEPVKLNTTISCDVSVDGNDVTVSVNVDSNATGFVELNIGGKTYYAPVNDGKAVLDSYFSAGTYLGNVNYLGDEKFNPAGTLLYFTVSEPVKLNTTISCDVSVDGNNVTVSAGVDSNATGFIEFGIGDKVVCVSVNDGNAVYDLVLGAGEYEVVVKYLGDSKFNSNTTSKSFEVTDKPVIVPIASEFSDIVISDDLSISVVLKDANANPIANAPIKYVINGIANTTITDNEGKFVIMAQNGDEINISYDGNDTIIGTSTTLKLNASAPPTVIKLATRFAIDLNPSVTSITINGYAVDTKAGEKGIFYSTVLLDENGNPMANVSMNFAVNNKIYNRTTYENGSFRPYQLDMIRAGRYTMALYYAGDETHNATLACVCFDLDKKPITIKASAKTYKATTKTKKYTVTLKTIVGSSHDGKAHLRSGLKVTLKVNGKTFTAKTNSKGKATFKITNLKKKAKYVAKIYYKGDKTYEEATKSVKLTVK